MAIIHFRKIINARNFCGLKTTDGRTVVNDHIIRSGSLFKATEKDGQKLKELGVNLIVDLRTPQEQLEKPNHIFEGIEYASIPLLNEQRAGISRESGASIKGMNKAADNSKHLRSMIPNLEELYPQVAQDDNCLDQLSKVVKKIMSWVTEDKGTVMYHCTAGKDRAGIVSAILQFLLGVDEDEIFKDYMQTNKSANKEARKYFILALIFKFDMKLAKRAYHALHAETRYLKALIKYLNETYGSIMAFCKDRLHIGDDSIAAFRDKMLSPC